MAVNYVTVKGYIKDGELKVELPDNVTDGEVQVVLPVTTETLAADHPDEAPLTDEEIAAFMRPDPKTGAEIIALGHIGGWEHKGITDSVEWVQEQRRKRKAKRGW